MTVEGTQGAQGQGAEGAGEPKKPAPPAASPYDAYGLDAEGNPIKREAPKEKGPDPMEAKVAALEKKLESAERALSGQADLNKKMEIVDRMVKAIGGNTEDMTKREYMDIFNDLKRISPPGVRQALEILESNPAALQQLTGSINSLHADRLVSLNTKAHERVLDLAKKAGFRGTNSADMNKMVYPYERAITEAINANPKLKDAFVSGNVEILDEIFNDLVAPHVAQRVRSKQARLTGPTVKTPPYAKASSSATDDSRSEQRPNLRTPQGRAAFHKQASARFFSKLAAKDEE